MSLFAGTMPAASAPRRTVWLNSRNWDSGFIILSCVLVFLTYGLYASGVPRLVVNMIVTLFIGGPHMFSTYTRTAMEPRFIRRYPLVFFASITLIPAFVISAGLVWFTFLLTAFFAVASFHVAEQFSYVLAAYARKAGFQVGFLFRFVDTGLILMSLHMPAVYLLTRGRFYIGEKQLLFPAFLQHDWVWMAAVFVWAAFLLAFLIRTANEIMAGHLHLPRLLFVAIAVPLALWVPTLSNLDVAFQGMNAWHSFQYLALTWFISRMSHDNREISLDFVTNLTKRGNFPAFYGFCFALTLGSAAVIMLLSRVIGFPYEQAYYLVVLSFLLIHYAFDHVLFTDYKAIVRE
jgi:hypothetical protein